MQCCFSNKYALNFGMFALEVSLCFHPFGENPPSAFFSQAWKDASGRDCETYVRRPESVHDCGDGGVGMPGSAGADARECMVVDSKIMSPTTTGPILSCHLDPREVLLLSP